MAGPAEGGAAAAPAALHALNCLAAWVRLGLLHELPREQTEALVAAALGALEAGDEQVPLLFLTLIAARLAPRFYPLSHSPHGDAHPPPKA
jgi:hypothetical protein